MKVWNYSWGLGLRIDAGWEGTVPFSVGVEKQMGDYFDLQMDSVGMNIAVGELVQRYLMTKMGEKHSILTGG